jgi:hypothetical protein
MKTHFSDADPFSDWQFRKTFEDVTIMIFFSPPGEPGGEREPVKTG